MIFSKKNRKRRVICAGFTLTELLVTIGVFTLLSTVTIANFREVDNSLVLQNVAHQVGIIIRKAQISGISVQRVDASGAVFPSYGVNFDITGPPPHNTFRLFANFPLSSPPPILYNGSVCPGLPGPGDECVQNYTLTQGYTIKQLCGNNKTGGGTCGLTRLDVSFTRPNPDAMIIGNSTTQYSDAEIVIQSRAGKTKTIVLWKTGQISIE